MIKKFLPLLLFTLLIKSSALISVETGIDRFFKEGFEAKLKGKRVGIITNQTGVNKDLESTVSIFLQSAKDFKVTALFAPEHGIDGAGYAWEKIENQMHKAKIPIFSLHGETRRPTKKMLEHVDVLIYDIQDLGIRAYTYATTLYYCMEEAAKNGISVIVLDRPNPMGGVVVDGPMLEPKFRSYIGYIDVPYCHGMTIGELARFFNEEYKIGCSLSVIPLKGWNRKMTFQETGLIWIPASPNVPESDTSFFQASTGIMGELGILNIGIGYTLPFKVVGAPWIDAEHFSEVLNQQKIPGVKFIPFHYRPFYGLFKGSDCHGVKICVTDTQTYRPLSVQYFLLGILKTLYPAEFEKKLKALPRGKEELFNKAMGNDVFIKYLLEEKYISWKFLDYQKDEREKFARLREKYLLYTD